MEAMVEAAVVGARPHRWLRERVAILHGEVVATIMADVAELAMPAPTVAWLERMLAYTVAGGKMTRGLLVPQVRGAPAASPRL